MNTDEYWIEDYRPEGARPVVAHALRPGMLVHTGTGLRVLEGVHTWRGNTYPHTHWTRVVYAPDFPRQDIRERTQVSDPEFICFAVEVPAGTDAAYITPDTVDSVVKEGRYAIQNGKGHGVYEPTGSPVARTIVTGILRWVLSDRHPHATAWRDKDGNVYARLHPLDPGARYLLVPAGKIPKRKRHLSLVRR
jgi:hypothetical protein